MERIILHPGHVTSRMDGQTHYIDASMLASLYGLNIHDKGKNIVVMYNDEASVRGYKKQKGDKHLYPRHNGNYRTLE